MHFLLCSDGTPEAESATRFAAPLVETLDARVTLLGVVEREDDREHLTQAMGEQRDKFTELSGVRPELIVRSGDPTREILARTLLEPYDLVVVGARRKSGSGQFWRSPRAYEIVRAVTPPVLVVVGRRERLRRVLICAGGVRYLRPAVQAALQLAAPTEAKVTLLHILPEIPMTPQGLPRVEEDTRRQQEHDRSLEADLRTECQSLVEAGVPTEVRLRRGLVLKEIAEELGTGDYDLVVTGMTLARGPVREYELGDVTREIINRAGCPVLVVRGNPGEGGRRLLPKVRRSGLVKAWQGWLGRWVG